MDIHSFKWRKFVEKVKNKVLIYEQKKKTKEKKECKKKESQKMPSLRGKNSINIVIEEIAVIYAYSYI